MLLKIIPTTAITLKLVGDTNITNINLQVVTIGQLQLEINQFTKKRQALKNKIVKIGILKVKMLLVKRFKEEKANFKGFLT